MQDQPEDPRIAGLKQDVVDLADVVVWLADELARAVERPMPGSRMANEWQNGIARVARSTKEAARQVANRVKDR